MSAGPLADAGPAGAQRQAGWPRWLRARPSSRPRPWGAGSPTRSSRCDARGARATLRRRPSGAGWRLWEPARCFSVCCSWPDPAPRRSWPLAGPGAAAWAVARRRARYRRAVERGLPQVATAVADALAGGSSVRAALASAAGSIGGTAGRRVGPAARRSRAGGLDRRGACRAHRLAFGRSASTRSPQRFSRSSSAAATSPGFCDASPPHRRSAIASPPTPTRPPRRLASPVCWWSPCRRAPRCSRS